jgi:hypothetical protein
VTKLPSSWRGLLAGLTPGSKPIGHLGVIDGSTGIRIFRSSESLGEAPFFQFHKGGDSLRRESGH